MTLFKCAHDNYIESPYCSVKKCGKIFYDASKQKGFSIFHCNIRSLEKNKSLLHDILSTVKTMPNIIAISESKIKTFIHLYIYGQILLHLWFVDLLHLWLKVITFMVSITFMVNFYYIYGWYYIYGSYYSYG